MNLRRILQRWDRIAYSQLCERAARLAEENDELRIRLAHEEGTAEFWREEAMRLHEELAETTGTARGITQAGHLVTLEKREDEDANR